jgi:bile acid:Na+ symporter, BASS family
MFDRYPDYEIWFARLQLVCFMLGMGVNLTIADFAQVLGRPRSLLIGLIGQIAAVPCIAIAINWLFGLEPAIALGLILVAAMPGGALAKVFVYLGRGNAPLTITLCALATLGAVLTVPATLRLLAASYVPEDFVMPVDDILADVVVFLLTPVAVGMAVRSHWPGQGPFVRTWAVRFGFVFLSCIIVGSIGSGRIQPAEHGLLVPIAIIVFCIAGQQLSMAPFYILRLPRADRLAVGIEVTMRNINLAILLNATLFHERPELSGGVLFSTLFYAAVALVAGIPLALNHRRMAKRERAAHAHAQHAVGGVENL